jgi:uncharacterized membrane protein YebE (DUF533 family)
MGAIAPSKVPKLIKKRDGNEPVKVFKQGGKIKKLGTGGMFGIIPEAVQSGSLPRLAGYAAGPIAGEWYRNYKSKKDAEEAANEAKAKGGMKQGGKVNAAGNYTKPSLRKSIVSQVKSAAVQGTGAGQWSARKAQLVAKKYKAAGGGYKD